MLLVAIIYIVGIPIAYGVVYIQNRLYRIRKKIMSIEKPSDVYLIFLSWIYIITVILFWIMFGSEVIFDEFVKKFIDPIFKNRTPGISEQKRFQIDRNAYL